MFHRPSVVLSRALPPAWTSELQSECELVVGPADGSADQGGFSPEVRQALSRAEGLLCLLTETVDETLLLQCPRLRVVSNMAVGVDNIDVEACTRRGIAVGHTPGVLTEATADLTMALLLSAARRLPEAAADAIAGRWGLWSPTGWLGHDLHGAILGIVGMGKIGRAVARRAQAFGMQVLYTTRSELPPLPGDPPPVRVDLSLLLRQADFVSLHVPLTADTRGLIGADVLRAMKPSAILINTARGPIVDTEALLQALADRRIAAAALDVTDPEPLPSDHPLYRLPNAFVVPHIGSATHGTRRRMAELAIRNLLAGVRGERLPHTVNPQVQDASKTHKR